ncbi:MAG: hypothetical protein JRJ84_07025 [Deltaproteobacteria bacterium]|nr:hypothetical protein [Deltaproteobacteria bacterium]
MTLRQWLDNKWLTAHRSNPREIRSMLEIVDRDIRDASNEDLSPDWRLAISYNATLQCALIALAASGYRPNKGGSHHYYAIESMTLTIGAPRDDITAIDAFRKKRNVSDYERAGTISEKEADESLAIAKSTKASLLDWLSQERPDLVP